MRTDEESPRKNSLVGERIGRFDVIAEIGTGGMASVYLARSLGSGGFQRLVAIKAMHRHLATDEAFVEMFLDEARVASMIHHPNVVPIIDVGQEDDLIFLIMDYVEGDSFSNVEKMAINLRRRVPLNITLRVVLDALAGLHAAHELCGMDGAHLKIIHRDVSPQNIVIGVDGSSRIVDFGIAKAETRITTTRVGMIKGKLNFMAPEQLRGTAVDRRVDIFGMGVTLWEAVTLRRLYAGENDVETARKIMSGEYPRLLDIDPKLPPALDEVVRQALMVDPAERYPTAAAFADAIEARLRAHLASPREVGAFISGVAAQKIERERRAVREWLRESSGPSNDVSVPVAEAPTSPRVSVPSAPPPSTAMAGRRKPTLAAPAPPLAAPAPAPPTTPVSSPRVAPAASAASAAGPVAGAANNLEYDDDGETALITRSPARNGAPPSFTPMVPTRTVTPARGVPRGTPPSPFPSDAPPEAGLEEARTVFDPRPPMEVAASLRAAAAARFPVPEAPVSMTQPEAGGKGLPQEPRERTQAISLVQRRSGPGSLEPQELQALVPSEPPPGDLFSQPPQAPVGLGPVSEAGYTLDAVGGATPVGAAVPEGGEDGGGGASVLLYVFVGIAVLASATTVLWYVLYLRG
jgi:serine/threonine-protein kinase